MLGFNHQKQGILGVPTHGRFPGFPDYKQKVNSASKWDHMTLVTSGPLESDTLWFQRISTMFVDDLYIYIYIPLFAEKQGMYTSHISLNPTPSQ